MFGTTRNRFLNYKIILMNMIRKPIVEGMFYASDTDSLHNQIRKAFLSELGPGKEPEKNKALLGAIVPHAGYIFSGACAAHIYQKIKKPETFILIGTNHSGHETCTTLQDFETLFGIVKNNKKVTQQLITLGIKENNQNHNQEHSLEVQLPFLQYLFEDINIVPILIGEDYKITTPKIKRVLGRLDNITIICSSDFTHYGYNYRYVPFRDNIKEGGLVCIGIYNQCGVQWDLFPKV